MIKKDNVNYRAFEGDFKPVNVFAKDNKVAGYVSESAEGQELELSNTYNDSYEDLKIYGKSEQKAKWNQAERAIKAGSYQVSAESGIYEVTIAEDLICTDDANKDRICFDSISGSGYRENMRNGVKTRTPLTFTKVESSTLPVLPWTAYGKQLIHFEPYVTNSTGGTTKDWLAPPFVLGETYYFGGGVCDDGTAINSNNSAFIILKDGVQVYNKSPNRAITITEDLLGADTVRLYTNSSLVGKTVTQFTGELGSSYSGSYEPFNPTPPESLIPSPDYPQQIYDLKDVTVTSRGRNLATAQQVYSGAGSYLETTLDDRECVRFIDNVSHRYTGITFKENAQYTVSFEAKCVQQASVSGESLIFRFFYTDGTNSSITESSNTDWKGYVLTSTAGKTVSYIGLSSYNYVNYNYIDVNTFQLEEGTERTPFDKYRCTSATIPLTLRSCGDDKDFVVSGTDIKQAKAVGNKQFVGTENIAWMTGIRDDGSIIFSVIVSDINPAAELLCNHFLQGEDASGNINRIFTIGSYQAVYFCMYANELGLTASDDESTKKTKIKAWFAKQNEIGFPVTVQYVLNTPIETEITDTWAQNMLALKTAPYYTKLYADKETGGLEATYKHF